MARGANGRFLRTHGLVQTAEYRAWANAIDRCENPRSKGWSVYGGRGIKVCAAWRASFERFLADMGERPTSKHSLDRIDVNGDYSPENCRWATAKEQAINRRNTRTISALGRTLTIDEWAAETGLPRNTIIHRFERGWDHEAIVTRPRRAYPENVNVHG